jgi:hypothetical protein
MLLGSLYPKEKAGKNEKMSHSDEQVLKAFILEVNLKFSAATDTGRMTELLKNLSYVAQKSKVEVGYNDGRPHLSQKIKGAVQIY